MLLQGSLGLQGQNTCKQKMRRDASDSKQPTDNISKNLVKWTHKQPYHSKDKVHLTSISGESSSVLYANMLHLTVD